MLGYWGMPEETAAILKEGRYPGERVLHTGDLFRTDEDGHLYFVGRKDDIIKSRGEKVSPREIENVLCNHKGIAEAAVVGVPDPVLGEAIKAVVVQTPQLSLTERQVKLWCARYLEDYMVPQIIEFRHEMPRSANGKIAKDLLVAVAAGKSSGE
jgi:acyl-CoA synthetase (AMP-forming)/AMP-acid ligase II